MNIKSRVAVGFDQTFIDVVVSPYDNEKLLDKLPISGAHWYDVDINFIAGGNGFNLARTLNRLNYNPIFVGPIDDFFQSVLKFGSEQPEIHAIDMNESSRTVILNLMDGERQFNDARVMLHPDYLSDEVSGLFKNSPIKTLLNCAQNDYWREWWDKLLRSACDIPDGVPLNGSFDGLLLIDPSDISNKPLLPDFCKFLEEIAFIKGTKIISLNELEGGAIEHCLNQQLSDIAKLSESIIVMHSAKEVIIYSNDKSEHVQTIKINTPRTFVGAGDAFNAGMCSGLLENLEINDAVQLGIIVASALIIDGYLPDINRLSQLFEKICITNNNVQKFLDKKMRKESVV